MLPPLGAGFERAGVAGSEAALRMGMPIFREPTGAMTLHEAQQHCARGGRNAGKPGTGRTVGEKAQAEVGKTQDPPTI